MTLKYESELLFDLMKRDGDDAPSDVLPYESELKEKYLKQVEGAYPKLMDYRPEWLNYNLYAHLPADFPVETLSNVTNATVDNVVPYAYRSASLAGSTKYRDIDTGEILETFKEGRKLELVSVKMPGLTTTGKNLFTYEMMETAGTNYSVGVSWEAMRGENARRLRSIDTLNINPSKGATFKVPNGYTCAIIGFKNNLSVSDSGWRNPAIIQPGDYDSIGVSIRFGETNISPDSIKELAIQLEEGTVATQYEPYQSNILTVNEEVTLRGIGDVKDELNLMTGEIVERVGVGVFDGSEDEGWNVLDSNDNYTTFVTYRPLPNIKDNKNSICDKMVIQGDMKPEDGEYHSVQSFGSYINILSSKASNAAEFKNWLRQNNITIYYPLATESVKTVELTVTDQDGKTESNIRPFEGTMHIMTNGTPIKPTATIEVPVEAITQNLMSFANIVEEEK